MDIQSNDILSFLNKYLSPNFRQQIEEVFYQKINANARLAEVLKDPLFLSHPLRHVSLFNDHGVVHVRDVAYRLLNLLQELNGIHFAKRDPVRLEFMKGYGALLAYVHDIGMLQVKSLDYDMHPNAAAQMVFNEFFDKQISALWEENSGNVAWRITRLVYKKALSQPPKHILHEMLALCGAHDKALVPVEVLNHPAELRRALQEMVGYSLRYQWLEFQLTRAENQLRAARDLETVQRQKYETQYQAAEQALASAIAQKEVSKDVNPFLKPYYQDFWQESFQWLVTENPEARELVDDVIDTLRVLRVANASRQRGAKLRATGEHQIFLDHYSGNAIYAINDRQKLFLLESKNNLLAGEVNLSGTEFTQSGDLRISFYCGHFADDAATSRAVYNAAVAVNEVQSDMIGSFARPPAGQDNSSGDYLKKWKPVYILLESRDDNPDFSMQVKAQLSLINPDLKDTVRLVPSVQNATEQERNRYLNAKEIKWDLKIENEMLEKISSSGHKIATMHVEEAFRDVKSDAIPAGEVLVQAGTLASFVYIPLGEGLTGYPLGGYTPFHAAPFVPLANVGVIRSDMRNATIVAEKPVEVLIIPREVYLRYWHHTYSEVEFIEILKTKEIAPPA
jgi:hypothetical protein